MPVKSENWPTPAPFPHPEKVMKRIDELMGYEKVNRELFKALDRRVQALERGDPPAPEDTPPALRAEEV